MPRKVLLFATLIILATLYTQGQSPAQPITPPATNTVQLGGPLLTTPTMTLPTPAPTAGISNEGRAGISVTENNSSNLATTAPTPAAATTSTETVAEPTIIPVPQPLPETPVENQRAADIVPSSSVNDRSDSTANVPLSVAEVAKHYQAEQEAQNAHRTLTNEDVKQILKEKPAISMPQNSQPNQRQ